MPVCGCHLWLCPQCMVYWLTQSSYASHGLQAGPASAYLICRAVGQSTCANSVRVYSDVYVGRDGWCAGVGDQAARAGQDGYAVTSKHFEHTIHGGLDAGIDQVGPVAGAPRVGTVRQSVSNGCYGYAGRSSHAGTNGHYEHAIQDDWRAGAEMAGAAEYVDAARYAMPIWTTGVAGFTAWGSAAGTIRQHAYDGHYEPIRP